MQYKTYDILVKYPALEKQFIQIHEKLQKICLFLDDWKNPLKSPISETCT